MYNILVVNDDGIDSPLLHYLAKRLTKYGKICVVAPMSEQSGVSHKIGFDDIKKSDFIEVLGYDYTAYKVNGSPADCVRYATGFIGNKFEYIFSGINNGLNVGFDVQYSGTIGGATEGLSRNMKACAISCERNNSLAMEQYLDQVLDLVFKNNLLSNKYVLNINFPEEVNEKDIYRFTNQKLNNESSKDSDWYMIKENHIVFTPLDCDRTNYEVLEKLRKMKLK